MQKVLLLGALALTAFLFNPTPTEAKKPKVHSCKQAEDCCTRKGNWGNCCCSSSNDIPPNTCCSNYDNGCQDEGLYHCFCDDIQLN